MLSQRSTIAGIAAAAILATVSPAAQAKRLATGVKAQRQIVHNSSVTDVVGHLRQQATTARANGNTGIAASHERLASNVEVVINRDFKPEIDAGSRVSLSGESVYVFNPRVPDMASHVYKKVLVDGEWNGKDLMELYEGGFTGIMEDGIARATHVEIGQIGGGGGIRVFPNRASKSAVVRGTLPAEGGMKAEQLTNVKQDGPVYVQDGKGALVLKFTAQPGEYANAHITSQSTFGPKKDTPVSFNQFER